MGTQTVTATFGLAPQDCELLLRLVDYLHDQREAGQLPHDRCYILDLISSMSAAAGG